MCLNGFLAHTSVQWRISNNHEEMLTNSLTSMKNAIEQWDSTAVFSYFVLCFHLLIWEGECGVYMWFWDVSSWINDKSGIWNCWTSSAIYRWSIITHIFLLNMTIFEAHIDINSPSRLLFIQQLCIYGAKHNMLKLK